MNELDISKEFLSSLGILEKVDKDQVLDFVARESIVSELMDKDTVIYRLAMSIYHSERSGPFLFEELEKPMNLYIKLNRDSSFRNKYPVFFEKMKGKPAIGVEAFTKTFICFAIATYLYFKIIIGEK